MKRSLFLIGLSTVLMFNSGCVSIVDSFLSSLIDDTPKDGRDLDGDGLTEREKRQRFEESYIREHFPRPAGELPEHKF